jgi:hypothetical protein
VVLFAFARGNWEERKFYTIEIYDQESEDIVQKFEDFLSKENVISDIAIIKAENLYKSMQKSNLIKETLPRAWEKIITEPDETLVDLLADTTERLCGYRPDNKAVEYFLMKIAQQYLSYDLISDLPIEIYSENIESKDIQNDSEMPNLYKQFWKSLLEKSNRKFDLFSTINPRISNFLIKNIAKGLKLYYHLHKNYGSVGIYIDFGKEYKELNKKVFNFLYEHRSEFEKNFGDNLKWSSNDEKIRSCFIYKEIYEKEAFKIEKWDRLQYLMVDNMFRLYNALKKYIPEIQKIANEYMNK